MIAYVAMSSSLEGEGLLAKLGIRWWVLALALLLILAAITVDLVVVRRPWVVDPDRNKSERELVRLVLRERRVIQQAGPYALRPAFEHLRFPELVDLEQCPDGRWYAIRRRGQLHVFANDRQTRTATLLLDIEGKVASEHAEEGLLGLALHPDLAENGRLFLYYTAIEPRRSLIVEYRLAPGEPERVDPASGRVLISVPQPSDNHNGGALIFGPDGMLYAGIGDGGCCADQHRNGQNLGTLLATIIRIDVDRRQGSLEYGIPPDNPFVGVEGARAEIWAFGLRNPWRMSFDRQTGEMWAGDVGGFRWEEVDRIVRGGNYGWRYYEGSRRYVDNPLSVPEEVEHLPPIWEYSHDFGGAVIGGYVYRGERLPALRGRYLFGDFVLGTVWGLSLAEDGSARAQVLSRQPKNVRSFAESHDGELYLLLSGGQIHELTPRRLPRSPSPAEE